MLVRIARSGLLQKLSLAFLLMLVVVCENVAAAGDPTTNPAATQPSTEDDLSDFGPPPAHVQRPPVTSAPSKPRIGTFNVQFTVRSELSPLPIVSRRLGWSIEAMKATGRPLEYDLSHEGFTVYVPNDYDGTSAYGLMVWIGPGGGGDVPVIGWHDVLDRHKLIWIGPWHTGNDRYWPCRVGLGLDAVANMKSRYRIDENRIYAAGFSGGGRAASMLGIGFPDVFAGGLYIAGSDYYRNVAAGRPGQFWARNFFPPPPALLKLARTRSRYVLYTSEGDSNQAQTKCNYQAFRNDGFKHVTYIEVPGIGHSTPNAEWFEKGIEALEGPK